MELTGTVQDGKVVLDQKCDVPNGTPATVRLEDSPKQTPPVVPTPENGEEAPPAELDVEKDVWMPMPLSAEILGKVEVLPGKRLPPCLILPEERNV